MGLFLFCLAAKASMLPQACSGLRLQNVGVAVPGDLPLVASEGLGPVTGQAALCVHHGTTFTSFTLGSRQLCDAQTQSVSGL